MSDTPRGAVLSRDSIIREMELGNIKFTPPVPDSAIGAGSVDLTLGNEFRTFIESEEPIDVTPTIDYKDFTVKQTIPDGGFYELKAGSSCLSITKERVEVCPNICGLLEGRSRFARLGISVHITASYMQPGVCNKQVLEIFNCSPRTLRLYPGTKLCQFIFLRLDGESRYEGRFSAQEL